jgi:hypothetical protein
MYIFLEMSQHGKKTIPDKKSHVCFRNDAKRAENARKNGRTKRVPHFKFQEMEKMCRRHVRESG